MSPPPAGRLPRAGDRPQSRPQPLRQLAALDLNLDELLEFLLALFGLREGSPPVEGEDQGVGRQMVEERRLRWIEVGLEAFDPVEVGARSHPLDVREPLVAHLRKGVTERSAE